jgi:hypothetical protein
VAATGIGSAVENVLDGEVDVGSGAHAGNLDAIRKAAQRPVRPTRTTVLWVQTTEREGNKGQIT